MAKNADLKALTYEVKVHGETVKVTTIHSSPTVFEAYGEYNGSSINAKAGSRAGALERWRHLAEKSDG